MTTDQVPLSTRRRAFTALAAVTAGLPLLIGAPATPAISATTSAAPTAASLTSYSVQAIRIPVVVGPARDQRCTIVADLYRPLGVDVRHRAPAILTTHGFGGSKDDANQRAVGKGFAQEGYVVLSYSGLGFGGSGCKITLDHPAWDGAAGTQLVDVLAGTKQAFDATTGRAFRIPYVAKEAPGDPRVGMIGGSYGGQVQFAVAMQDKRVDALIPIITWNDLAYSLAPNNTSFVRGTTYATPGVHKKLWTSFFFGLGVADGVQGAAVDPARNVGCPNFDGRACAAKVQLDALGYPLPSTTRFAREASVTSYLRRITAPTLIVQGQKDTLFNLQEAAATFKALRARGTEARMIWQSWGHSYGGTPAPGELDLSASNIRDTYLGRRFIAWMNHWVRGVRTAPVGPRFCYFRDWVRYDTSPRVAGRAIAEAYACGDRYTGDTRAGALYFTGTSGLTPRAGAVRAGSASYANVLGAPTSYSETSALEGVTVNQPPRDTPGTFAAFTSRPVSRAFHIVGAPRLRLHLDAPVAAGGQGTDPAMQLVLFAKLYVVAPDGTVTLKHRLISPVRVTDVTMPVDIELPGVVQKVPAGHRLRVVIAASDFAYAGNHVVQPVTVKTSPTQPSVLRLPLAGSTLAFFCC